MANRSFGHVLGVAVGVIFENRNDLGQAGVHRPRMAGISYSEREGADSIIISGGYEDDEDHGDLIIYTGPRGKRPATGRQIRGSAVHEGNLALGRAADEGLPVRVIRGARGDSRHSPPSGYRHDGLYSVERYWPAPGRSGFRIYRYRSVRLNDPVTADGSAGTDTPPRATVTTQRIVRNTAVMQWVKEQHQHACQVCGLRLVTPSGRRVLISDPWVALMTGRIRPTTSFAYAQRPRAL